MKFGPVATPQAEGATLAHGVQNGDIVFKKGRVLSAADVAALTGDGVETVIVARLGADDVPEDQAAAMLAEALAGDGVRVASAFTGRANLYATVPGVFCIRSEAIHAINAIDEAITIATLPAFDAVDRRAMLATVKIIPYAVRRASLDAALSLARALGPVAEVSPFRAMRVGLISTSLPQTKPSMHAKNRSTLEARLEASGAQIVSERIVAHATRDISSAIRDSLTDKAEIVLVYSASAIADRHDVVPAGLVAAGGEVLRFGMPVDPGNLLLLGRVGGVSVVGLPGCARSPKMNGFDWVLQRLLAGVPVTGDDIARMGVGGLLKEIPTRPQPRDRRPATKVEDAKIAAVVLAAGRSSRMGSSKQLAQIGGMAMIRRTVMNVMESQARPVVVVTGHDSKAVAAALDGLDVTLVHNAAFASGLSASLRTGLDSLGDDVEGALVVLGDMPAIRAAELTRLVTAFDPAEGRSIVVATHDGKRGNPVLWPAAFFEEMRQLSGDVGAKSLLGQYPEAVCEIEIGAGALADVDTPDDLHAIQTQLGS